jgi:hypothetical protein
VLLELAEHAIDPLAALDHALGPLPSGGDLRFPDARLILRLGEAHRGDRAPLTLVGDQVLRDAVDPGRKRVIVAGLKRRKRLHGPQEGRLEDVLGVHARPQARRDLGVDPGKERGPDEDIQLSLRAFDLTAAANTLDELKRLHGASSLFISPVRLQESLSSISSPRR